MPLYEYECTACGHRFERIQKFSDPPIEECPSCGQPKVQKLLSSPAIQFKGTGWYITDYAKSGKESGKESKESRESGRESKESRESGRESKESGKESKESRESKESSAAKSPAASASPTTKASGE